MLDPIYGLILSIDHLSREDALTLQDGIEPIADMVNFHTLITEDADAFTCACGTGAGKQAADQCGLVIMFNRLSKARYFGKIHREKCGTTH